MEQRWRSEKRFAECYGELIRSTERGEEKEGKKRCAEDGEMSDVM